MLMIRHLFILFLCLPHLIYAQGGTYLLTLGTAQDGGYPHMGCTKQCCNKAWENSGNRRYVVSLALVDSVNRKWWLFEATPDIKEQLHYFNAITAGRYNYLPDGIFVTHAHIGHYTGLMQLGREVMGSTSVPVYVLPKMKTFLETNGPWSQLVSLHNIELELMLPGNTVPLLGTITVTPVLVPHRDEYSETAGFKIHAGGKNYLFIPDINKWEKWDNNVVDEVKSVDIALLDGTFYDGSELPGRNMSEVPHPFITETIRLFDSADAATRSKVYFIHFNHTNPLLWDVHTQKEVEKNGFHVSQQGLRL